MKRSFFLSVFALLVIMSNPVLCQEQEDVLLSKKGKVILPESKQFAIGMDASPIFTYVGNIMNLDMYNTLNLRLLDNSLCGKYLVNNNLAARLKLRINSNSGTLVNMVESELFTDMEVKDTYSYKNRQFAISPGFEFRKGSSRMQILYGAELTYSFVNVVNDYKYGNRLSVDNHNPLSTINFTNGYAARVTERVIREESGKTNVFGLRAFAGLEYFIFPKISLSTEVGISYRYSITSSSSVNTEFWDFSNEVRSFETESVEGPRQSGFATDILNGQIVLLFYL